MDIWNPDQNTTKGAIYLAEGDAVFGEMERAIGISVMGVSSVGGSIFSPKIRSKKSVQKAGERELQIFAESWTMWLQQPFTEHLAETFVEVYMAAAEMRLRRVTQLDLSLGQCLSGAEARRSRAAGQCFLEGKSEMQRAPQWQKYARSVEAGECPGHVVTVFALQSALYHLPLLSALTAYVYFEWRAGMSVFIGDSVIQKKGLTLQKFQQDYPQSMQVVRQVFAGESEFGAAISAV
ncbi:MAG: hypothetical protein L3J39_02045 [Verrucomicrobiales bacterium]|nr:hypothetical protein [Verrucomicrobiales bacterium]